MNLIFSVSFVILIRAYSDDLSWNDPTEDLFFTSSSNLFDDTLDDSAFLNPSSSIDDSVMTNPSLIALDEYPIEDSFASNDLNFKEDSTIFDLDLSLVAANCEDSLIQSRDSLFDDYSTNPSTDTFASMIDFEDSSFTDDLMIFEDKAARKRKKVKYVPPREYVLSSSTGTYTPLSEAIAEDGIPIRPKMCRPGKRRTCCRPANPPHRECWVWPDNPQICPYAKNQYCCAGIWKFGGSSGIDCEDATWIEDLNARPEAENADDENPSEESLSEENLSEEDPISNQQLQELFPIFRPLPDLNPPAYCKPETRRRI